MTYIGKRIRSARQEKGWSQADLAGKLKVSQPLVSLWEREEGRPDDAVFDRLERVLGPIRTVRKHQTGGKASDDGVAEGTSTFGEWVNRQRNQLGMSVAELADEAGLSVPAIYAIENGASTNPRHQTKQKLEKALQQALPEDAQQEVEKESTIEGLGQFTDFDPHDDDDLPGCGGIYVLYDVSERPIYVGEGGDISKRIRDHSEKFWFKRPIVEMAAFIEVSDRKLRRQIEATLIKFLKSNAVINKQLVDRGESD